MKQRLLLWLVLTGSITALAGIGGSLVWREPPSPSPAPVPLPRSKGSDGGTSILETTPSTFVGSAACSSCHTVEHDAWAGSHHALAERACDPERDGPAFRPERKVPHGSLESVARESAGRLEVVTAGPSGVVQAYSPIRVIGVAPLEQFIVPFPGGRFQVMSLAYDRARNEWFDVFGSEDRKPHEWGFWSNRGLTWNSMCASCHMTDVRKGYDSGTDSYATTWLEAGVGCEACHGPRSRHVEEATREQASGRKMARRAAKPATDAVLDTCGSCHARRVELTGRFVPGDPFVDHYRPVLPDETDVYYADGQVRDENFEYVSFLLSRMHGEGVRCVNCHNPHSGRLHLEGNALCLSCHQGKVDPGPHSHHDPANAGGRCVSCHMPVTTYMQRHPRRDHGFTIPDPLLTREHGIPNACNRCHADKNTDWAVDAAEKWFGHRLERNTRARARALAKARRGLAEAVPALVAMTRAEKSAAWRSVATGLLAPWAGHPMVRPVLSDLLGDPAPLVRAAALRALEHARDERGDARPLLEDPVRLVRVEAAWILRKDLALESRAGEDLARHLACSADQPQGALQSGLFRLDRGGSKEAEAWFRKAIAWDSGSAPFRQALALAHEAQGDIKAAIGDLAEASKLAPADAEYPFALGLAHAAAGQLEEAVTALAVACELDPRFARAWYNLGLARSRLNLDIEAISAIGRAQAEDPEDPEYPFARATIHLRRKEVAEAREAALDALMIDPEYPDAMGLLEQIEMGRE